MKATEKQTLKAFLIALSQQGDPLPETLVITLNQIAQSLETRVNELTPLARQVPTLFPLYEAAYIRLIALEKKRTRSVRPAPQDDGQDLGNLDNLSISIHGNLQNIDRLIQELDRDLESASQALSHSNPVIAIRQFFLRENHES